MAWRPGAAPPRSPQTFPAGLEVKDLELSYGSQPVFSQVTFSVARGRYACLLGPSGSGKTSLLYAVAGLVQPRSGSVAIGGVNVHGPAGRLPTRRRNLGMVFQDYALWPHMSALDNVAFPLRARGSRDGAEAAATLLSRVGLAGYEHRRPEQLSGGQKQRVALARALVAAPDLVLFDEPLSALDAHVRTELRTYLGRLSKELELTVLHVTHDPGEAFYLADVVGVMLDGRIVQWDTPVNVYRRPANERVARLTGAASFATVDCIAVSGGYADVAFAGGILTVPAQPSVRPGTSATLMLRPDAIAAGRIGDGAYREGFTATAAVRACNYTGTHYAIDAALGDDTVVTVNSPRAIADSFLLTIVPENAWLLEPDVEKP